nr:site-specific integrase [Croceibacterium selenioxidans]
MKVKNAKPGTYGDGAGLYLRVKPSGAKSWVLRVQFQGRRQDIGLGGYPADRSLAEAREEAAKLRKLARRGANAIAERDREKVSIPTFTAAMEATHREKKKGWTDKAAKSFEQSLRDHIVPRIGAKRVDDVDAAAVIAALSSTWIAKPQIAKKLRARVMQVLRYAKAQGWRGPVPESKDISDGLAKQPKGGNFAAMPFADVPAFMTDQLGKEDTSGRLALLFTILTAARSGEVRNAEWTQVDLEARTWTRPAVMMKMRDKHVVTLNEASIAILKRAGELFGKVGLIFPGSRPKSTLSDMTLSKIMRASKQTATVHGFRSSFRDWAAEMMPTIPAMVAEMALAHKVGTATEQAYLRSDLRDMRQSLMDAWGRFVAPSLSGEGDNVVSLDAAKKSTG